MNECITECFCETVYLSCNKTDSFHGEKKKALLSFMCGREPRKLLLALKRLFSVCIFQHASVLSMLQYFVFSNKYKHCNKK